MTSLHTNSSFATGTELGSKCKLSCNENKVGSSTSCASHNLNIKNNDVLRTNSEQNINECIAMSDSCVDSGIAATISMSSELCFQCRWANDQSNNQVTTLNQNQIHYHVGLDECNINIDLNLYKKPIQRLVQDIGYCEEVAEDDQEEIREVFSRMTHSQTSYASMLTSAFHEKLNNLKDKSTFAKNEFYREANMLSEFNAIGGNDYDEELLSNEKFITKFVLAEQICRFFYLQEKK